MAARAIWKGVITFGAISVPVKLYSAVEDRHVHFKLLHKKDQSPVKQAMVNPETDEVVPYDQIRRAYHTGEGEQVLFTQEELSSIKPDAQFDGGCDKADKDKANKKSREIDILKFLPQKEIDHRWYERPYYLGPDGSEDRYAALTEALALSEREGLAHWVMRKKEYYGALRLYQGYLMLMTLRYADQVVPASELEPPKGKALDKRELEMARQLINMLDAEFEPEEYQDDYRHRVLELIEKKQQGKRVPRSPARKKKPSEDLSQALEASLKGLKSG